MKTINTKRLKTYNPDTGKYEYINAISPFSDGVLYGKKYVACGDSFTEGDNAYPHLIAERNNMTLVNMAVGGSKMTNVEGSSQTPFSAGLYKSVPADANYITISFGLNEITNFNDMGDTLVGSKTDADTATIWGAYNTVFEHLITQNPYAKIGVIIQDAWMTEAYANVLKEICSYWGIPYLDLKSDNVSMGIGGKYIDTSSKARTLKNAAFQVASDNAHPNAEAHKYRSTIIENWMRSL